MYKKILFSAILIVIVVLFLLIVFTDYITTNKSWVMVLFVALGALVSIGAPFLNEHKEESNKSGETPSGEPSAPGETSSVEGHGEPGYTFGAGDTIDFDGY